MQINSAHNPLCHIAVQLFVLLAGGNALAQTAVVPLAETNS
jgi:hypothetical protein